jgi:hypothetical protein
VVARCRRRKWDRDAPSIDGDESGPRIEDIVSRDLERDRTPERIAHGKISEPERRLVVRVVLPVVLFPKERAGAVLERVGNRSVPLCIRDARVERTDRASEAVERRERDASDAFAVEVLTGNDVEILIVLAFRTRRAAVKVLRQIVDVAFQRFIRLALRRAGQLAEPRGLLVR